MLGMQVGTACPTDLVTSSTVQYSFQQTHSESVDKLLIRRQVGRIFNPPLELSISAVLMAD
jgi:hypothetical protein